MSRVSPTFVWMAECIALLPNFLYVCSIPLNLEYLMITNAHLLFVRVAVMLLHILDVVIEVAPVVARAELVVALHVQELVRLFKVALRRPHCR